MSIKREPSRGHIRSLLVSEGSFLLIMLLNCLEKIRQEKNRLAEENEKRRNDAREEARIRSENAIANLILTRKRRR